MGGNPFGGSARLGAAVLLGTCALLGACAVQPAGIGEAPGDYEAFVRELMAEAAKAPDAAPETAARAVRSAAGWLGGSGDATRGDTAGGATGGAGSGG